MRPRLLAEGRATEVFEHGSSAVLRRYRPGEACDVEREAHVMRHVASCGYRVPTVLDVGERELLLERLAGRTMLEDLARRPWRLRRHAATLAELHDHLHAIEAPAWLDAHPRLPPGGEGASILHLDLHPGNVVITSGGPVVIDWSNASRGAAPVDVAITWVIVATSTIPGPAPQRAVARLGRTAFLEAFLSRTDRARAEGLLPPVARARLDEDPHLLDEEAKRLRALARCSR